MFPIFRSRFEVSARFQKREVIDSTGTVCFLAFSLFILLFIYSVGVGALRHLLHENIISQEDFNLCVVWLYVSFLKSRVTFTYSVGQINHEKFLSFSSNISKVLRPLYRNFRVSRNFPTYKETFHKLLYLLNFFTNPVFKQSV